MTPSPQVVKDLNPTQVLLRYNKNHLNTTKVQRVVYGHMRQVTWLDGTLSLDETSAARRRVPLASSHPPRG